MRRASGPAVVVSSHHVSHKAYMGELLEAAAQRQGQDNLLPGSIREISPDPASPVSHSPHSPHPAPSHQVHLSPENDPLRERAALDSSPHFQPDDTTCDLVQPQLPGGEIALVITGTNPSTEPQFLHPTPPLLLQLSNTTAAQLQVKTLEQTLVDAQPTPMPESQRLQPMPSIDLPVPIDQFSPLPPRSNRTGSLSVAYTPLPGTQAEPTSHCHPSVGLLPSLQDLHPMQPSPSLSPVHLKALCPADQLGQQILAALRAGPWPSPAPTGSPLCSDASALGSSEDPVALMAALCGLPSPARFNNLATQLLPCSTMAGVSGSISQAVQEGYVCSTSHPAAQPFTLRPEQPPAQDSTQVLNSQRLPRSCLPTWAPVQPPTQAPTKVLAQHIKRTPERNPTQAPKQAPAQTLTQAPTQPPTQPSTQPFGQSPIVYMQTIVPNANNLALPAGRCRCGRCIETRNWQVRAIIFETLDSGSSEQESSDSESGRKSELLKAHSREIEHSGTLNQVNSKLDAPSSTYPMGPPRAGGNRKLAVRTCSRGSTDRCHGDRSQAVQRLQLQPFPTPAPGATLAETGSSPTHLPLGVHPWPSSAQQEEVWGSGQDPWASFGLNGMGMGFGQLHAYCQTKDVEHSSASRSHADSGGKSGRNSGGSIGAMGRGGARSTSIRPGGVLSASKGSDSSSKGPKDRSSLAGLAGGLTLTRDSRPGMGKGSSGSKGGSAEKPGPAAPDNQGQPKCQSKPPLCAHSQSMLGPPSQQSPAPSAVQQPAVVLVPLQQQIACNLQQHLPAGMVWGAQQLTSSTLVAHTLQQEAEMSGRDITARVPGELHALSRKRLTLEASVEMIGLKSSLPVRKQARADDVAPGDLLAAPCPPAAVCMLDPEPAASPDGMSMGFDALASLRIQTSQPVQSLWTVGLTSSADGRGTEVSLEAGMGMGEQRASHATGARSFPGHSEDAPPQGSLASWLPRVHQQALLKRAPAQPE